MLPSVLLFDFSKIAGLCGPQRPGLAVGAILRLVFWAWRALWWWAARCPPIAGQPLSAFIAGLILVLLRRWRGERARWLGVYWFGALLPLVIVLVWFSVMQRSLVRVS